MSDKILISGEVFPLEKNAVGSRGTMPIDNSKYSIIENISPFDSDFIAIEDETTNKIDPSILVNSFPDEVTLETIGENTFKITAIVDIDSSKYSVRTDLVPTDANVETSFSVNILKKNRNDNGILLANGGFGTGYSNLYSNRYGRRIKHSTEWGHDISIWITGGVTKSGDYIIISNPLIEHKEYYTSFTDSFRPVGSLHYEHNLNCNFLTAVWFRCNQYVPTSDRKRRAIIAIGEYADKTDSAIIAGWWSNYGFFRYISYEKSSGITDMPAWLGRDEYYKLADDWCLACIIRQGNDFILSIKSKHGSWVYTLTKDIVFNSNRIHLGSNNSNDQVADIFYSNFVYLKGDFDLDFANNIWMTRRPFQDETTINNYKDLPLLIQNKGVSFPLNLENGRLKIVESVKAKVLRCVEMSAYDLAFSSEIVGCGINDAVFAIMTNKTLISTLKNRIYTALLNITEINKVVAVFDKKELNKTSLYIEYELNNKEKDSITIVR